ncbi:MAG TPA: hypothetical protein DGG95_18010 [Cytophagales bacterium]|jgi:uncharacterized SAM-binding protein YcdF (DUF218 family)|nr:hypothetical protein [Cytophagales bacterium]
MFFTLSKVLTFLVMPFTIVCVALVLSLFVKKSITKKRFLIFAITLLIFCGNDFITNEVMTWWEVPVTLMKDVKNYSWGIILTGVTKYDTGPRDRVYFSAGADRVTHAIQLYKMGKIKKILVSGGSGRLNAPERTEANEIADVLLLMGVPKEDIVIEDRSRNTHESAVEVKKILEGKSKPSDCLLITSAFHMRRSAACFAKVGLPMDCFSVDFHSHKRKFTLDVLLIPSEEAFHNWQILAREWMGMVAYKLAGYI